MLEQASTLRRVGKFELKGTLDNGCNTIMRFSNFIDEEGNIKYYISNSFFGESGSSEIENVDEILICFALGLRVNVCFNYNGKCIDDIFVTPTAIKITQESPNIYQTPNYSSFSSDQSKNFVYDHIREIVFKKKRELINLQDILSSFKK